jgi:cobalt-zinc-cadmium efflux system outer membrane protein
MKPLPTLLIALVLHAPAWAEPAAPHAESTDPLTLRDALALAIAGSPELRAASRTVRVHDALTIQAAVLPNPELRGEVENVGGSGAREGFEDTESTVRVLQRIELGGKRGARRRVAEIDRDLAAWGYEVARRDVVASTTKAFVTVLAAQERRALAAELERLARETVAAVERSVAAGAAVPVEALRARVTLGRTEVEGAKVARELGAARTQLAARWGATQVAFPRVRGDLARLDPLPSEAVLAGALADGPDLARWTTERAARRAALALERARRIPDVTVGAGARHFSDNGDNALVVELSLPLPIFDRNRGGVVAAREQLAKGRDEADMARVDARVALSEAYERLAAAHDEASSLAARVLPDARRSASGTMAAFRQGLLRPVDALEAQRALFELQGDHLRALERFHLAAADVERLTGMPLHDLSNGGAR